MGEEIIISDDNCSLDQIATPFRKAFLTDKRYIWLTGGRGGAKSYNVFKGAVMMSNVPGHRILTTRYTMSSAEISIIPEFKEKIEVVNDEHFFDIKRREVNNTYSGSDILFRGIKTGGKNQTANLKSIQGITTWINEETEELVDEDDFDTIDMSIRTTKRQNRIFLIMNPSDRNHWTYKRWLENSHRIVMIDGFPVEISTHPEVCHIHVTYLDNLQHLSPSFIKKADKLKLSNPDKYGHKLIGIWRPQAEGVVFSNWREGVFDDSLPYAYGMDYGWWPDPQTVVKVAIDKKRKLIYVKEELYGTEMPDTVIIEALSNIIKNKRDLLIADTNEPRTSRKIRDAGFNIQKAKKPPGSIMDGIRGMQDYTFVITPDSNNVKREFNTYVWNDKRASIPVDDNNHTIDPIRYIFLRLTRKSSMRAL